MTATEQAWSFISASSPLLTHSQRKPLLLDGHTWKPPLNLVDVDFYNAAVLQLPPSTTEDDLDDCVALEARSLGLLPVRPTLDVDGITSSTSTVTIRSNSLNQGSIQSYSTAPTSCASSDYRKAVHPSPTSEQTLTDSDSLSQPSDNAKKPGSPFRRGFRKMTGFRKRRSAGLTSSSTLSSISSEAGTNASGDLSIKSDLKSPLSLKSSKSSWSQPMSGAKSSYEHQQVPDPEAMKRSMECKEMLNLQMAQLDQKARFLRYQVGLISDLREQCDRAKASRRTDWDRLIAEQFDKKERAVEELEARQLEEELKIQKEHDMEKRAVMVRLRHMEAYCRNPTPPPTPNNAVSGRSSNDSSLPERKVTDKDYHSLAQQYRERDAMDTLHTSKINVLRGKQKKAVENLMNKKEREINKLEQELQKELDAAEKEFSNQQSSVLLTLGQKKARLEARWKTQALIERTRVEKATGLQYAPLPDIVVVEDLEQSAAPL